VALIVMADDGVSFDGATPDRKPLGGAEAAFVALAEALAARGHRVLVRNNCPAPLLRNGVDWAPIGTGLPEAADLYIANRGYRLIGLVPRARTRVFWLHTPGDYILKPRYLWPLLRTRPILVFSGTYHASTVPKWVPNRRRVVIPYGIEAPYRGAVRREQAPPPIAIFTSNPLRGLDWLLDLWAARIVPAVAKAELHIYAGPEVYGTAGVRKVEAMRSVLARAAALKDKGVRCFAPVPKAKLRARLLDARVMLYRGDPGETFCLAVAEAQALGVPAVVMRLGSLAERIVNGVTGAVADDDASFVAASIALLTDDALWRRQHEAALRDQRGLSWGEVAARFEGLIA
jgi:glycosyltransferase involved in cell wall biosynthesis